jgi:hypothetical protein
LKVFSVKPLGDFLCLTLKHWCGNWDIHCVTNGAWFWNKQLCSADSRVRPKSHLMWERGSDFFQHMLSRTVFCIRKIQFCHVLR